MALSPQQQLNLGRQILSGYQAPQQSQQTQQSQQPQKDGFWKGLGKGIVNPFVRTGASLYAAGAGIKNLAEAGAAYARGDKQEYQKQLNEGGRATGLTNGGKVNVPLYGEAKIIDRPGLDAAGVGAEGATWFLGGGATKAGVQNLVKQGLKQSVIQGAKQGAIIGGVSGLGTGLQKENKTFGSVAKDTAIGGVAGGLFGAAVGALSKPASKALQSSAETSYSKALGATTKDNKYLSDKLVPELMDRRVIARSRNTLFNKAQQGVEKAGDALEEGYKQLPKDAQTDWYSVFKGLSKAKDEITVNGVVMDVGRHNALQTLEKDLLDVVGGGVKEAQDSIVSVETARKVRQILDKSISQKSKVFGLTGSETDKLAVQKLAANSIRKQLAEEFPNIGKLNKEFNFWNNLRQVVGSTINRTKSQTSLSGELAEETGAIVGATMKGTAGGVVLGASTLKFLKQAIQSTAWRTTSAVLKSSLAESLAKGNFKTANILLQKIIESSRNQN
jgi:hypothetical protein